MYDAAVRAAVRAGVLARLDAGESLRGVSVATGISRATLREWRERDGAFASRHECPCPRCQGKPPPLNPYLYLLGHYLGDGCISRMGRTWVLRIATCDDYPGIRAEVITAIRALVSNAVNLVANVGCTYVNASRGSGCTCSRSTVPA